MDEFLAQAFSARLLDGSLIPYWIQFLEMVANHTEIPESSVFKGKAVLLLAFMLNPLVALHETIQNNIENLNVSKELAEDISMSYKKILQLVPLGFDYSEVCEQIAMEFTGAIESYSEILIAGPRNYLFTYKELMGQEVSFIRFCKLFNDIHFLLQNNVLLTIAIKSLTKLGAIDSIRGPLKNFLFEQELSDDEDVDDADQEACFMRFLAEFSSRKSLKLDIMSLARAMHNICDDLEFFELIRDDLYLSIFSGNKKLVTAAVKLMVVIGDDFWLQTFRLLDQERVNLPSFLELLSTIDGVDLDPHKMLQLVLDNVGVVNRISEKASLILVAMLKREEGAKKEAISADLATILEKCLEHEKTFSTVLDVFFQLDFAQQVASFKEDPARFMTLVKCLLEAFEKFDSPPLLYTIVTTLQKLHAASPKFVLDEVRKVFRKIKAELMRVVDANEPRTLPLQKFSMILENKAWNLMGINFIQKIYFLNQQWLTDLNDPLFFHIVRLQSNVFKHIWMRMAKELPLGFTNDEMTMGFNSFIGHLVNAVKDANQPLADFYLLLSSLLDLLVLFQPKIPTRFMHELFTQMVIKLTKPDVRRLAGLVSQFVFPADSKPCDDDPDGLFQREFILRSWISFWTSYEAIPSLTANEKIIGHYRLDGPFKPAMELLLTQLLTQKNVFEQSVAFATLGMSNSASLASFRAFHRSLEDFMSRHFLGDKVKQLSAVGSICSYVLGKLYEYVEALTEAVNDVNRLNVLDYVSLFIKSLDPTRKKTLEGFIPSSLQLSHKETRQLEAFKASLRQ